MGLEISAVAPTVVVEKPSLTDPCLQEPLLSRRTILQYHPLLHHGAIFLVHRPMPGAEEANCFRSVLELWCRRAFWNPRPKVDFRDWAGLGRWLSSVTLVDQV